MNYLIRLAIFVFLISSNIANASTNFVGIIGAAIGEIKNQNNNMTFSKFCESFKLHLNISN